MKFEHDDCPCLHAVKTETTSRKGKLNPHVMVPDDDCSFCDGTGDARFMVPNNPKNVVRGR